MFQQHSFLTKPNLSFAAHRAARAILLFGALVVPLLLHANVGVQLSKRGGIDIDGSNKSVLLARSTSVAGTPQLVAGRLVNGQFQFSVLADPGGNFRLVGVTDLDGNGKSDLLFQNVAQGESGDVTSWLNFESNNATALRRVKQVWDVQAVGDLDGDGRGDVVWRYLGFDPARPGDTGVSYVWFTNASGQPTVRKRGGAPLTWKLLGAADLNGDGAADMVYVSPDNSIRVLMATSNRTCANYAAGAIPAGFVAQAFADFSGNGRGDILIRNPSTGQTALISLSAAGITLPQFAGDADDVNASCTSTNTTLPSATTTLPTSDTTWQLYATGDYNGDGVFDVVWLRPDGVLSLWQMNRNIAIPTLISNAGTAPSVANNFGVFHGVTAPVAPAPSSFARIQQKVFAPGCNSCHTAGNSFATQSGLVLDEAVAYRNLRNASVKNSMAVVHGMKQVVPRDLENSLLYQKLLLWDPAKPQHFGSPMPLGSTSLTVGQLEFIKRWIEAGAPETGDNIDAKLLDDRTLPAYAPFVPLSPPAKGYQLTIEPFSVQPNFERELFVLRDLKNSAPIYVSRIETRMRTNSHHFLLYTFQSNTPSAIIPPVDMVRDIRNPDGNLNFVNTLPMGYHTFFAGAMTPESDYSFPPGIALLLPANARLDLNAHYVNKGTSNITGEAFANLHTVDASQVTQVARTLNLSNTTIPLPPGQRATHRKTFTFSATTRILMLTSHMHALGEKFVIRIVGGARDGQIVYENTDWAHPAILTFNQPIVLAAGEGLMSEITYNNTTNRTVSFGLTSEDEMGIIFGYYY
ncbi:MAG: hypothetical protein ING66_05465 [Rhodocyclaceae bacterium]|nr:hypothetical protein [Rhodocyclaceae bacterium]MCA3084098.1 hypothetical protein [Rhodocyclaceae bacterium]